MLDDKELAVMNIDYGIVSNRNKASQETDLSQSSSHGM